MQGRFSPQAFFVYTVGFCKISPVFQDMSNSKIYIADVCLIMPGRQRFPDLVYRQRFVAILLLKNQFTSVFKQTFGESAVQVFSYSVLPVAGCVVQTDIECFVLCKHILCHDFLQDINSYFCPVALAPLSSVPSALFRGGCLLKYNCPEQVLPVSAEEPAVCISHAPADAVGAEVEPDVIFVHSSLRFLFS